MTSTYTIGHAQIDGRRNVIETHRLDDGSTRIVEYLATSSTDCRAVMESRALALAADIAAEPARRAEAVTAEIAQAVAKVAEVAVKYPAEAATQFEAAKITADTGKDFAKIIDLYQRINCGECAVGGKLPYDCARCDRVKDKDTQAALIKMGL
jgi:hypothetical protein